jgi:MoxR-like ATPase
MAKDFSRFSGTDNYITSPELRHAVNVAAAIERPLLVRGEPGTGKTLLATAIAEDLGLELIVWNVKSTSKAADGLYVYDTVKRLQDSRFGDHDVSDIRQYIELGPLGRALTSDAQVVLLIDEIDKADLEFPNDLLHELDVMEFTVIETGDVHRAAHRPIVVITSNAEKELPDPFLRRCIFHFIEFPDEELMTRIVHVHHPDVGRKLLEQCLARFYWLRKVKGLRKRPSTSELVDWIGALLAAGVQPGQLAEEIPFLGALIKKEEDVEAVTKAMSGSSARWPADNA